MKIDPQQTGKIFIFHLVILVDFWPQETHTQKMILCMAGGTNFTIATSGWYYYTGDAETTATNDNGPIGNNTLWTKNNIIGQ